MENVQFEWEECVNQALVAGSPSSIREISGGWSMWFGRLSEINAELARFQREIGESFTGKAGDAYQAHLTKISEQIEKMDAEHQPIKNLLGSAADSLETAQATMPVPETMLDEVKSRSEQYQQANANDVWAVAGLSPVLGAAMFVSNDFKNAVADSWVGDAGRNVVGWFEDQWNDFNGEQTEKANAILNTLNQNQAGQAAVTGTPAVAPMGDLSASDHGVGPGGTSPGGGYGGAPSIGGAGAAGGGAGGGSPSFDPSALGGADSSIGGSSSFDPTAGTGVGTGAGTGSGATIGAGSGYDPYDGKLSTDDWSGTSLAGAGGDLGSGGLGAGGLGAGGLGAGGLGSGGGAGSIGSGAGLGSGGSLGAGAGIGGGMGLAGGALGKGAGGALGKGAGGALGKGVSMPMVPAGGAAGGIGGGARGAGRGAASGRGLGGGSGLMGGGAGAGKLGDDGPTRDSWLHEDEDVWGGGGAASTNWSWDDA